MNRAPCDQWPRILNPARGEFPPAAARRTDERVLCVGLQDANEPMEPMQRGLERSCGVCRAVDWRDGDPEAVRARVLATAHEFRPTVVFLRLQRGGTPITPQFVQELRPHCAPEAVIVHWNGDQYEMAGTPAAAWMVELGRVCDTTLLVNTQEQGALAHAGVRHPGFLAAGYDPEVYQHRPAPEVRREVVCLANRHRKVAGYDRRRELLGKFAAWGEPAVLYGKGWDPQTIRARAMVTRVHESAIYSGAAAALSVSMHEDLARYTSDRLWRMLGCGAVALVEQFPGWNACGLRDGINCVLWSGWEQLRHTLDWALSDDGLRQGPELRQNALELAKLQTWEARGLELLACVDAVRAERT